MTEQVALTSWRPHREEHVKTRKGCDWVKGTHSLAIALGGTSQNTKSMRPSEGTHSLAITLGGKCQNTERMRQSEGCSLPGDHTVMGKLGHRNNAIE